MGSGVLFLSRCERNNEINEFLDVSSVSSSPSDCFVPSTTSSSCFLFPLLMDGSLCSDRLLLIFVPCFGKRSAPHHHGVTCHMRSSRKCSQVSNDVHIELWIKSNVSTMMLQIIQKSWLYQKKKLTVSNCGLLIRHLQSLSMAKQKQNCRCSIDNYHSLYLWIPMHKENNEISTIRKVSSLWFIAGLCVWGFWNSIIADCPNGKRVVIDWW